MSTSLLRTPFHDWHVERGGRMVEFAGWSMPVQYTSIVAEHQAVRRAAGLFDISHMGRICFTGPDAARFLDHVVTNSASGLQMGQVCYALVTNESGGVLDDVLVYRLPTSHLLVVNASNRLKILDWLGQHRAGFDVEYVDLTFDQAMVALQGPRSIEILQPFVSADLASMPYYFATEATLGERPVLVSRTGYTGEDGFEVILPANDSASTWRQLIETGAAVGLAPAGLGCRDTLRLEAAMPLYGHELNESIDPLTAGLGFAVKLNKTEFIGREALAEIRNRGPARKRVGLELAGRRIAREGSQVFVGDRLVGEVTSGTFSPTLERSIAMAYVEVATASAPGPLEVDVRGRREPARIVKLPFHRRQQGNASSAS